MQIELSPGELLDRNGHLVERGWARDEARRYNRAAITASRFRIKEWDYYCVLTDEYGLALVVADIGYLGLLSVTWLDFQKRSTHTESAMVPLPLGAMRLPQSADAGDIVQSRGKLKLSFRHEAGARLLAVDCPSFHSGEGLKGEIRLAQPPMDRMTIATPFPNAPKAFYYNQKINCMAASGDIIIGRERYRFEPHRAFGVLDWGRGVWTYDNIWYWGSASGLLEGVRFGFNIGHGFGDTSSATENMLFYDGKAHKLDQVTFHLPKEGHASGPWTFTSNDGRFEMQFAPIIDRADSVNLGIIRQITHQVFGRFSGTAVLDDGRRLAVSNFLGFAEEVQNRW